MQCDVCIRSPLGVIIMGIVGYVAIHWTLLAVGHQHLGIW